MTLAVRALGPDGVWLEACDGAVLDCAGITFPSKWLEGHSAVELAEFGMEAAEIIETPRPAGVRVIRGEVEDIGGVPTRAWVTEAWAAPVVEQLRTHKVDDVRAEAERRIRSKYSDADQQQMARRAMALALRGGTLSAAGRSEAAEISAAGDFMDAVRAAGALIEADIPHDAAGIELFDVAGDPRWPA